MIGDEEKQRLGHGQDGQRRSGGVDREMRDAAAAQVLQARKQRQAEEEQKQNLTAHVLGAKPGQRIGDQEHQSEAARAGTERRRECPVEQKHCQSHEGALKRQQEEHGDRAVRAEQSEHRRPDQDDGRCHVGGGGDGRVVHHDRRLGGRGAAVRR